MSHTFLRKVPCSQAKEIQRQIDDERDIKLLIPKVMADGENKVRTRSHKWLDKASSVEDRQE